MAARHAPGCAAHGGARIAAFIAAVVLWIGAGPAAAGPVTADGAAHDAVAAAKRLAIPSTEADVHKGLFLVASRSLSDPNFQATVILVVDHGPDGTRGLVVNRPTDIPFTEAMPEVEALRKLKDTLYVGGPVARYLVSLLVRADDPPEDTVQVFDSVYFSHKLAALLHLLDKRQAGVFMRAYVGHAGWAPGQLDMEIQRGDWHLATADATTIFDTPAGQVWPTLIDRLDPHLLQASISPAVASRQPPSKGW
jgi:putative transcriptional regulator